MRMDSPGLSCRTVRLHEPPSCFGGPMIAYLQKIRGASQSVNPCCYTKARLFSRRTTDGKSRNVRGELEP